MLKYFKRQKSRRESVDNDIGGSGSSGDITEAQKRHSLRSTSSFCDELFLEELMSAEETVAAASGGSDVAIGNVGGSAASLSLSVGTDEEDAFKYHSRLSMSLPAIVNDPNCLSYFVQYLETKEALPLIKFYLDTENFKTAAMTQMHKKKKQKSKSQKKPASTIDEESVDKIEQEDDDNDDGDDDDKYEDEDNNCVPELKTLCDLSMRKPLTDDEKSQIYAETNKQITKCNNNSNNNHNNNSNTNHKQRTCAELEPTEAGPFDADCCAASVLSSFTEAEKATCISAASIRDAMTIYQKYLIAHAPQFVCLPVAILSQMSLLLCKRRADSNEVSTPLPISANCFDEAQRFILQQLEREYCNDFRQSNFYCRYCIELIESGGGVDGGKGANLSIYDILYSEATLFFFMEFLEQQGERDCLDFWTTAINYRKSFGDGNAEKSDKSVAQTDAMIIYEKFFSLQSDCRLWMSSQRLRCHVEERICAVSQDSVACCFDLPLQIVAKYLKVKYLNDFLKCQLFQNYLNELKMKIHEEIAIGSLSQQQMLDMNTSNSSVTHKLSLRRTKASRHRKTLSDCTSESTHGAAHATISQQNTLLAMESHTTSTSTPSPPTLKQQQQQQQLQTPPTGSNLNIDARHLTNPNLLWHRRGSSDSGGLKFGRVNALGRYERDFDTLDGSSAGGGNKTNWSFVAAFSSGNRIKNAMRKLVNLPEDQMQEEIAWQVAEMIVKDVTSVTLCNKNNTPPQPPTQ